MTRQGGINASPEREVRASGGALGRESSKQDRDSCTWRVTNNRLDVERLNSYSEILGQRWVEFRQQYIAMVWKYERAEQLDKRGTCRI